MILEEGINKIWTEDKENQEKYLDVLVKYIRKVPEFMVDDYKKYLKELGVFYVPNELYMRFFFGSEINHNKYGVYSGDYCLYDKRMVIPIRGLDGNVKALCAYDNGQDEPSEDFIKYSYSPKSLWKKNRYMFINLDELRQSVQDGYICIVDGLFDKITLSVLGINSVSLMGSKLPKTCQNILEFVDKKIVLGDNDLAGKKLTKAVKSKYPKVYSLTQGEEWDIDDYLKSEKRVKEFRKKLDCLLRHGFVF